jgi:hypothetical protein
MRRALLAVNRVLRLWRFDSAPQHHLAPVAQWAERRPPQPMCAGSTPAGAPAPQLGADRAVVVNSADTSVFQTEAAGSMPASRSTSERGRWDCWLGHCPFKAGDRDRYPDRLRTNDAHVAQWRGQLPVEETIAGSSPVVSAAALWLNRQSAGVKCRATGFESPRSHVFPAVVAQPAEAPGRGPGQSGFDSPQPHVMPVELDRMSTRLVNGRYRVRVPGQAPPELPNTMPVGPVGTDTAL